MFKIAGAILVFASCAGIGYGKSVEYRRRIRELLLLKKMMLMLRGEVRYGATPLPDAFDRIGDKIEHVFGMFLKKVSRQLKQQPGKPLSDIWSTEMKKELTACNLTKEDQKQLQRLGSDLGYLDREMQISTIDFYVEQLEGTIEGLEKEQGKRSRVYNCLGIFAGIMINLVLL